MSGVLTDYLAAKLLNHTFRNVAYTSPTTTYLGLYTTATTKAGGGTEVAGGSYARAAITWSISGNEIDQASTITITGMPSCTVTHLAVLDASTAGNMLAIGMFASPRTFTAGQAFSLAAADLRLLLN